MGRQSVKCLEQDPIFQFIPVPVPVHVLFLLCPNAHFTPVGVLLPQL